MSGATNLHRKVALSLRQQLYTLTEKMLNSGPSFEKYCKLRDDLANSEIPLSWPKASPKKVEEVSKRLPAVSYLAGKKDQANETKRIEEMLLEVFPSRLPNGNKSKRRTRITTRKTKPSKG